MKIGILGCGQLARMLTLSAYPLAIETLAFVANPSQEKNGVTALYPKGFNEPEAINDFAANVDVITYENENVDLKLVMALEAYRTIYPSTEILAISQDRLLEKNFLNSLEIATAPYREINCFEDLQTHIEKIGFPSLIKTRRFGYDGKGQFLIKCSSDLQDAWNNLKDHSLIIEGWVNFEKELSIIAVRDKYGNIKFYPLIENQHKNGILYLSKAPVANEQIQNQAQIITEKILNKVNYVGILAIEFFLVGGKLLVNEMAPRVHNSGHWTIEGAITSQFENHIRAVTGLPLGSTQPRGLSIMLNCIGTMPARKKILQLPNVHYHDYGKEPRPNRKLGHITINADDESMLQETFQQLLKVI